MTWRSDAGCAVHYVIGIDRWSLSVVILLHIIISVQWEVEWGRI